MIPKTKLIIMDRGSGKTTELIRISEETGYTIVVGNRMQLMNLKTMVHAKNAKIPEPILIEQLLSMEDKERPEVVLIDEAYDIICKAINEYCCSSNFYRSE